MKFNLMYRKLKKQILQSLCSFRMTSTVSCHSERSEESAFNLKKILFCILVFCSGSVFADETAISGKNIASKWENAIIIVKITIKQKMILKGKELYNSEEKLEINGTVLDSTGLVVSSLQETDPSAFIENMMQGMPDDDKPKHESEITDIKIRFSKNNEIPAKIVLRDKDIDLAFIRPINKIKENVQYINLKDSVQPEILDRIICLDRLGKIANEVTYIGTGRIQAIVNKPRTFYIPDENVTSGLGIPVFSQEKEKIIGIMLLRSLNNQDNTGRSFFSRKSAATAIPIIMPTSEIAGVSSQVPAYEEKQ
ncbi:MAG: hypothetical protein HY934_09185 [Candidatus Firestonebacteria bacterium]|nr:hypothetical protein [Candidatus Firestonebacteria bacterium]